MKPFNVSIFAALVLCLGFDLSRAADTAPFVPSNPPEMKPLQSRHSPAYRAVKMFRRGLNLGGHLEVPPARSRTCSPGEFAIMRAEGFDHVRVPIAWNLYTGPAPDFTLSPEIFAKADFIVTNALAHKLAVIINIHNFDDFMSDPAGQTDKFLAIWRQVAAHYAKYPKPLAFELLNEPKDAATTVLLNPIYAQAIAEIRKSNPRRTLFVGPCAIIRRWNCKTSFSRQRTII